MDKSSLDLQIGFIFCIQQCPVIHNDLKISNLQYNQYDIENYPRDFQNFLENQFLGKFNKEGEE